MSTSKIIQYLLKYSPSSEWIMSQSNLPFLPLSLPVPTEKILKEWQQISHQAIEHRSTDYGKMTKNVGWKSLTLYGIDQHETEKISDSMNWTSISEKCPDTTTWLKETFNITNQTGRIRFMLLEPHGFIVPHNDRSDSKLSEINIAITNPKDCIFRFKEYGTVPFVPGLACMMDVSKEHFVVNNSDQPRLHIIVHSTLKDSKIIKKSYADRYYYQ